MKITKQQLQSIIKEVLSESSDWYDEEHETMADRKYADNPGQEMKDRIAAHQGVDPRLARTGQEVAAELEGGAGSLREPWDGIEENAGMIGDNALKIEWLARKLGIEIPTDPKL